MLGAINARPSTERLPNRVHYGFTDAEFQIAYLLPLLRLVDDFYSPDLGVVRLRREREQQFALAVGMETVELPDYRAERPGRRLDRKSTRLNSSHLGISYAVFC